MQLQSSFPKRPFRDDLDDDPLKVLVVDDDITVRAVISSILSSAQHHTLIAEDGATALGLFTKERPDLVLLDVNMPTIDGFEVARRMREHHGTEDWVPIIFLSGDDKDTAVVQAINAGGDDYLVKPVGQEVLMAKIFAMQRIARMRKQLLRVKAELEGANAELQRLAMVDGLTGVANRRYFDDYLDREWHRQLRFQRPLALILIDVDHFKIYNDHYGHQRGDQCLQFLAKLLQQQLQRTSDLVARYGGEEFVIVLPEFSLNEARLFAEALRRQVCLATIAHVKNPDARYVTISLGVTSLVPKTQQRAADLIALADQALYRAKDRGRNCVVTHPETNS